MDHEQRKGELRTAIAVATAERCLAAMDCLRVDAEVLAARLELASARSDVETMSIDAWSLAIAISDRMEECRALLGDVLAMQAAADAERNHAIHH